MDSINEQDARALLSVPHYCDEADPEDWQILSKPIGAFSFEQGLVDHEGHGSGLVAEFVFYRSPETGLITVKMSVFSQKKRQPRTRVYQLEITTKSYNPDNWHDEAHEHFGKGRTAVPEWKAWKSFSDVLDYFSRTTNIEFRPPLEDPELLRLRS